MSKQFYCQWCSEAKDETKTWFYFKGLRFCQPNCVKEFKVSRPDFVANNHQQHIQPVIDREYIVERLTETLEKLRVKHSAQLTHKPLGEKGIHIQISISDLTRLSNI